MKIYNISTIWSIKFEFYFKEIVSIINKNLKIRTISDD